MYPRVSIIILNWNNWKDTIECLESLYQINYPVYNVILVDNGSEDDSIKKIREYCDGKIVVNSDFFEFCEDNKPIKIFEYFKDDLVSINGLKKEFKDLPVNKRLILIKNDENYGFAEGNNISIRFILKNLDSDYILLLNNDTVVDKSFLNHMIDTTEKFPNAGVVGSKTFFYDYNGDRNVAYFEGGKISYLKGKSSHITNKKENMVPQIVDYIEGSCFLVKTHIIEDVGLLDKDYFLYWEETDWCSRIKRKGYDLVYTPKARIWHKIGTSISETHIYYKTRNRFLFMKKNSNRIQMLSFLLYLCGFDFWYKSAKCIIRSKNFTLYRNFISGFKDGFKLLF